MITPTFFEMADSGRSFTQAQWAKALGLEHYQFNSPVMFSALTGVPVDRIAKEVSHEPTKTARYDGSRDGGAVRGQ